LHDLPPFAAAGVPKSDPAIEINTLEVRKRHFALCPPRSREFLLGRIRDGARPQEEAGERAAPDGGRSQAMRSSSWTILAPHVLHVIQT
jgi:hypothetical protein